ncbi:tankyrase [Lingula anatina]|uniref:Tankyrase n=1 Tax=Lingula anatina TaxID=7574 RepID=A0A1S3KBI7_LINAN|nr:tankyrase [Lingula anatina]|eukprot:XP_013419804.1 tankyrase [Lingula anatina]
MKYNASRMAICTLLSAIKEGDLTASKRLLERKDIIGNLANIDYLDEDCDGTALFWACSKGLLDIVETLIANGADVDSRNAWGAAPLHGAADNNHCDIVRFLIKNGAKVDLTTINGDTPCHLAAYRGYLDVVKLLVDEGCDIWKENGDGSTALEEAKNRGHYHIVKFIRDLQYSGNIPKAPERSESPSPPAVSQYATIFPPTLQCKKRLQRSFIDLRACPSYTQAEHLQNSRPNSLSVDLGTLSSLSTSPTYGHLRQRLNHGNISISEGEHFHQNVQQASAATDFVLPNGVRGF